MAEKKIKKTTGKKASKKALNKNAKTKKKQVTKSVKKVSQKPKGKTIKKAAIKSSKKKTITKNIAKPTQRDPYLHAQEMIDSEALERGDDPKSVVEHLGELRSRLLVITIVFLVIVVGSLIFLSDHLYTIMAQPFLATGKKLHGFKLFSGFMVRVKLSVITAVLCLVPLIVFHLWRYIRPAVAKELRRFAVLSIIAAVFLFYGGVAFVFFVIFPMAIPTLLDFYFKHMQMTIGVDNYFSTLMTFGLAMGVLFEFPIVVMILTKIGIMTPYFLIKFRKHSIIVMWIIAALITSQDVWTQVLVAVPLMFLYEISILLSKLIYRKRMRELEIS